MSKKKRGRGKPAHPKPRTVRLDKNPTIIPKPPGSFKDWVASLNPGPPPFGWRDVTSWYCKGESRPTVASLGLHHIHQLELADKYIIELQVVRHKGLTYRRVAVALAPFSPDTKDEST